jgi:hypothetical protein
VDRLWNNGSHFLKKLSKVFDFRMGVFGTFFVRSVDPELRAAQRRSNKKNLFESTPP